MTASDSGPPQTGIFALTGEFWTVGYGGVNCSLRNSLGLSYLQRLLQHPGEEFHALDLLTGPGVPAVQDVDEAHEQAGKVGAEIDQIQRELLRSLGLRGRDRRAGSEAERARINATRHLRAAIERIAEHHDALGKLLGESIRTGTFCSYLPKVAIDWKFC
jgi:hypothetical protein